ncbi:hypothetical protein GMORB2_6385 [Geosmithia morbida]|uniref:Uncharacterized protein n=1 Tax=Geosmithia morbida TaxID=1094350 RepID=A0A9P4YXN3_9HYPO|nr:uncharacterized protein GMORB2_6385 [Geosmithia morbida]KAF4123684.1 hypothetical protein GMORB2_6385 [Geosmithia morbida]
MYATRTVYTFHSSVMLLSVVPSYRYVEQSLRDALYKANTELNRAVGDRDRAKTECERLKKRNDDLTAKLQTAVESRDDYRDKYQQSRENYAALNENWVRRYVELETKYGDVVDAYNGITSSPPTSSASVNNESVGSLGGGPPPPLQAAAPAAPVTPAPSKKKSAKDGHAKDDRGRARERERERERAVSRTRREDEAERQRLSRRFEEKKASATLTPSSSSSSGKKKRPPLAPSGSTAANSTGSHRVSVNNGGGSSSSSSSNANANANISGSSNSSSHRSVSAKPLGRSYSFGAAGHVVTPAVGPGVISAAAGANKRLSQQYYHMPRTANPFGPGATATAAAAAVATPPYLMGSEGGVGTIHSDGAP